MKKFLTLSLFFACMLGCFAQKSALVYQPKNIDSLQKYISDITVKKSKSFVGPHQKEVQKILEERKVSFLKDIKDSTFIFDARINNYLKPILTEIYRVNPEISHNDFYFFIDKSPVPNAACYGNGVFTINLGLFDLIGSDDELAFILCHEMAHHALKHTDKKIQAQVETINSKETKKKFNKAKNQKYGRRQALTEVQKNLSYNFLRRSRSAETQADSLGFHFYSKTRFNKAAAQQSLKKLGLCDTLLFTTDTQIRRHFNFDDYPFKEDWVSRDETLFDLKEESDDYALNKDSLKTHPDIPFRIEKLEKLYKGTAEVPESEALAGIKKIASGNTVAAAMDDSRLDVAMYEVLSLSEKNEIDKKDYCRSIAYLLKRTYELKESHRFGKFVGTVNPFSEEKYLDEVRLFLHHLELKNIRKIGLRFCQKYQQEMDNDPEFNTITAFFTNLNPKQ